MEKIEIITLGLIFASLRIKKKYGLSILITLELIILTLIAVVVKGREIFFTLLMICVGAREGAVGLAAIIRIKRCKRGNMISKISDKACCFRQ